MTARRSGSIDAFLDDVRSAVDAAAVVTDPDLTAPHEVDWTRRYHGATPAVIRPADTGAVAAVVQAAGRHGVALVPQGGNTGLVGGSVPRAGEVVLDLRRLDRLDPVDRAAAQVTVGAGVTLERLAGHAESAGLAFGVDLGARSAATIGGMVATNAGGNHVVRHGPMRHQLLGVEAVLADGSILSVNPAGLVKDNTGYDLAGLICGSEGTLAVVTGARLRLVPRPRSVVTAMLGYPTVTDALATAATLRRHPDLLALELLLGTGLAVVARHRGRPPPVPETSAAALLVEVEGSAGPRALQASLIETVASGPEPGDTAVASDAGSRARLWAWRDAHPEAAAGLGVVHKADVTLPATEMEAFLTDAPAVIERVAPGATTLIYGHLGDGNIHVNVVGPDAGDDRAIDAVLALVVAAGGSVSAEHGIGVAKRAWLIEQRGQVAVDAMATVKAALDPAGILNPGVLVG